MARVIGIIMSATAMAIQIAGVAQATTADTAPTPSPVYPDVTKVHVINSCHLDIGFADSSANIINRYFDNFFPLAATARHDSAEEFCRLRKHRAAQP